MFNRWLIYNRGILCASSLLAMAFPVWALQDNPDDYFNLSLEDLSQITLVSASEFNESLLTVASSVSYINESQWQKMSVRRSRDVLGHLPGVQVVYQALGTQSIHIRGYTNTSTRGHSTLIDGVPVNSFAFNTSNYQISDVNLGVLQSMEVIRGPVSVQYGSDAFHGALALHTYSAQEDETQVSSNLASNGFYNGSVRHTTKLSKHYFNASFDVLRQADQNIDFDWSDATSGESGRGQWGYEDESSLGLIKWGSDNNQGWAYELGLYLKDETRKDFPGYGRFFSTVLKERNLYDTDSNFQMLRGQVSHSIFNEVDVSLQLFYWRSELDDHRWFSYTQQREWSKDEFRSGAKLTFKKHHKNLHTRWSLSLEKDHAKITRANGITRDDSGVIISDVPENYDGFTRDMDSISLQGETEVLNQKVVLHYGARFDNLDASGDQFSPRLGLVYLPTEVSSFKLLYGKGFRASSAGERGGFGSTVKGNPELDPETIDTYELLFVHLGETFSSELVFFHSDWKNSIINIPSSDVNFFREYVNQGENEAQGLEASITYQQDKFNSDVSASFVESKNEDSGQQYVVFPRRIFNVGLGYEWPKYKMELYWLNRIEDGSHENSSAASRELKTFWQSDMHVSFRQSSVLKWRLDVVNMFDRNNELPSTFFVENGLPGETFSMLVGVEYKL